jgi:hypothetical protein
MNTATETPAPAKRTRTRKAPEAKTMPEGVPPMPKPSLRYGMRTPDVVWWMFTYQPAEAKEIYKGKAYAEPDLNAPMPVKDWDAND